MTQVASDMVIQAVSLAPAKPQLPVAHPQPAAPAQLAAGHPQLPPATQREGHSWEPASACVPDCLPADGSLAQVGRARLAAIVDAATTGTIISSSHYHLDTSSSLRFNGSQFYQLAGIQLVWPLFKANDNKYKIRQARIDMAALDEQYQQLTQQVSLEQETTMNNYNSAMESLRSLTDAVSSAREAYRLAERRFNEGQALQIELIDARTQMTNSELRYSQGRLSLLNKAADLERITASYKF